MPGTRTISTTSRCELSSSFFFFLQDKKPKEIHAILTDILACFLPVRAKDLSAPCIIIVVIIVIVIIVIITITGVMISP